MSQHLPDDFVERRNRSKTVNPFSVASNPGDFRVQWTQFFRAFPQPARGVAFGLMFLLSATLRFHWLWSVPLLVLAWFSFLALRRVREHFEFGNTLPGVIVSQKPPLVAVLTDLGKGGDQFNTVKVLDQPLRECGLGAAPVGTRLAAVALYKGSDEKEHWDDFFPVLVDAATRDGQSRRHAMDSFSGEDWRELEDALATLPSPPPPGLHSIGWNLPPAALDPTTRHESLLFMSDVAPLEPRFHLFSRGENAPRVLCVSWTAPKTEEKRPDATWVEAVQALAQRKQTPDALLLDFSKWIDAPAEWVDWWRTQAGRADIPLVLVLPDAVCSQLELVNVQSTREGALDWMEKRLGAQ